MILPWQSYLAIHSTIASSATADEKLFSSSHCSAVFIFACSNGIHLGGCSSLHMNSSADTIRNAYHISARTVNVGEKMGMCARVGIRSLSVGVSHSLEYNNAMGSHNPKPFGMR